MRTPATLAAFALCVAIGTACAPRGAVSPAPTEPAAMRCPVERSAESNSVPLRRIGGPFLEREELLGGWSGGLLGQNGHEWTPLRVRFDCESEASARETLGIVEASVPFRLTKREAHFDLSPALPELSFSGELIRGRLRGVAVHSEGAISPWFLERTAPLDPERAAEYAGAYDWGPDEHLVLYRDEEDSMLLFDRQRLIRLLPVEHEAFHTPFGEDLIVIRNQSGVVGQVWLTAWLEPRRVAQRIDRPPRREIRLEGEDGFTAPGFYRSHPGDTVRPGMAVVSTADDPFSWHSRLVADAFHLIGFSVLEFESQGDGDAALLESAVAHLLSDELVLPEALALVSSGTAGAQLALAEQAGAFGATVVTFPPTDLEIEQLNVPFLALFDSASGEIDELAAEWNDRFERVGQFDSVARAFDGLAGPGELRPDVLWKYDDTFFTAILTWVRMVLHDEELDLPADEETPLEDAET